MTIDTAGTTSAPPVSTAPPKSAFARMAGVLFEPGETFADIARKPDFVIPLVLFLLIGIGSMLVMVPRIDWDSVMQQQMSTMKKQQPNMSEADLERAASMGKAMGTVMTYISPILSVLWYLLLALVLLGAVRLMAGEGTFKQAFSATLYAQVPLVLYSIILAIVVLARGTVDPITMNTVVKSNPAFLVDVKTNPVLFSLLSSFDLFTIWVVILLIFGFSALSKLSWAKTAAIVVSLWVVMILIKIGFAAMGAAQAA